MSDYKFETLQLHVARSTLTLHLMPVRFPSTLPLLMYFITVSTQQIALVWLIQATSMAA